MQLNLPDSWITDVDRQLIEAEGTTELLRPVLPQLVGEYFRIMSEVENDAILSALQVVDLTYV